MTFDDHPTRAVLWTWDETDRLLFTKWLVRTGRLTDGDARHAFRLLVPPAPFPITTTPRPVGDGA